MTVPILESERLILRPIERDDAASMYAYASDPETTRYVTFPTHTSIDDAVTALETVFLKRVPEAFAVVLKSTQQMIGTCDFWPVPGDACFEMGYIIHKDYWGQGLIPEAAQRLLDFAFHEYGVRRMEIRCFSVNTQSRRVIEKLGFVYEGCKRQNYRGKDGLLLDTEFYGLLKEDYK